MDVASRSRGGRHKLDYQTVLDRLAEKGISIRVASPKLVTEEVAARFRARCGPSRAGAHGSLRWGAGAGGTIRA